MTKTVFPKLVNALAPMATPQVIRIILLVGILITSLLMPQVALADPAGGGNGV